MKIGTVLLAASLLTLVLPVAAAGCRDADPNALAVGGFYVGGSAGGVPDGTLWQESNNVPGLQRVTCEDDDGRTVVKDARVL